MLRNNRDGYGLVAIALHWAIALLFIRSSLKVIGEAWPQYRAARATRI